MSTEDFNNHIQKRNHKDKESSLKLSTHSESTDHLLPTAPLLPKNDANGLRGYERSNIKANPNIIVNHNENGCIDSFRANSVDSNSNGSSQRSIDECTVALYANTMPLINNTACELRKTSPTSFEILKDAITNMKCTSGVSKTNDPEIKVHLNPEILQELAKLLTEQSVFQLIFSTAIDLTSRMIRRPFDEIQITALLMHYFHLFDPKLKILPFGSATYGFAGSNTNFNILVVAGISCFSCLKLIFIFLDY